MEKYLEIMENNKMILIVGSCGTGKSVLIKNYIDFILDNHKDATLYLVDMKQVELSNYRDIHAVDSISTEEEQVAKKLKEIKQIIATRFDELDIMGANMYEKAPIYLIFDEIEELASKYHTDLKRILETGRAANIHVVASTQCPEELVPNYLSANTTLHIGFHLFEEEQALKLLGTTDLLNLKTGQAIFNDFKSSELLEIPFNN